MKKSTLVGAKILILRFSSIGDIILCTPIIRAVKNQLNAVVHFATKEKFEFVLKHNPYIDKFQLLQPGRDAEFIADLRHERYDLVMDLHHNLRTARIKWSLGVQSLAFDKINIQKWMMTAFKIDWLPQKHLVDRYFDSFSKIGLENDGEGLDFHYPKDTAIDLPWGVDNYAVYAIGGSYATKRMPAYRIAEFVSQLVYPVILIGGDEDRDAADEIIKLTEQDRVINLCGSCSLYESAFLIENAGYVISHDTATMHIAAAFNRPLISIWGNTIPKFGMYPYMNFNEKKSLIIENNHLSCRPCSKLGHRKCPKGHFKCMTENDLEPAVILVNSSKTEGKT